MCCLTDQDCFGSVYVACLCGLPLSPQLATFGGHGINADILSLWSSGHLLKLLENRIWRKLTAMVRVQETRLPRGRAIPVMECNDGSSVAIGGGNSLCPLCGDRRYDAPGRGAEFNALLRQGAELRFLYLEET